MKVRALLQFVMPRSVDIPERTAFFSEGKLWKNGSREARAFEGLRQMEGGETEVGLKITEGWKCWVEEGNGE